MSLIASRALRALLGLMLALSCALARADFNDGVLALMTGDYDKALKTLVPLAETSNHAYAQYFLGRMYSEGRGVEKNAVEGATKLGRAQALVECGKDRTITGALLNRYMESLREFLVIVDLSITHKGYAILYVRLVPRRCETVNGQAREAQIYGCAFHANSLAKLRATRF